MAKFVPETGSVSVRFRPIADISRTKKTPPRGGFHRYRRPVLPEGYRLSRAQPRCSRFCLRWPGQPAGLPSGAKWLRIRCRKSAGPGSDTWEKRGASMFPSMHASALSTLADVTFPAYWGSSPKCAKGTIKIRRIAISLSAMSSLFRMFLQWLWSHSMVRRHRESRKFSLKKRR